MDPDQTAPEQSAQGPHYLSILLRLLITQLNLRGNHIDHHICRILLAIFLVSEWFVSIFTVFHTCINVFQEKEKHFIE